ncbi:MAG: hypothetical protein ISQ03_00050 [Pseudomonadales bacterium]|jgi:Tfp pilus assembly protein PilX|nr:hypothetical protein [Pseudomonadales bacterium]
MNRRPWVRPRERGAVLTLVLGVLLLIAILGLAGLEGSVLELRMASAQRNHAVAFYAAEAALSEGERFLRNLTEADLASFRRNSEGLDQAMRPLANPLPAPISQQPGYFVEYLGPEGDPPTWHRFRVTAKGYGAGGVLELTRTRILGLSLP